MSSRVVWVTIAVAVGVLGIVLWTQWRASAPPGATELDALKSSGKTSALINGWDVSYQGRPDSTVDSGESWVEAWIVRPVSVMAKLRSWLRAFPRDEGG
jgi:hypothetical protein